MPKIFRRNRVNPESSANQTEVVSNGDNKGLSSLRDFEMKDAENYEEMRKPRASTMPLEVNRRVFTQARFDEEFEHHPDDRTILGYIQKTVKKTCQPKRILGFFPCVEWIRDYHFKHNLLADLIAGLTLGIIYIPQGLAYAKLALIPPVHGLYSSLFSSIVYPFFGTAIHCAMGPEAVASLLVGESVEGIIKEFSLNTNETFEDTGNPIKNSVVEAEILNAVVSISFMCGIFHLLMGFFRLHFIAAYLSDQLIGGFTTASAFIVATSQVPSLLNIPRPTNTGIGSLFMNYISFFNEIIAGNASWISVVMSLVTMIFILLCNRFVVPFFKRKFKFVFPVAIVVIVVAILASYFIGLHDRYGLNIVGDIPTGIPTPRLPDMKYLTKNNGEYAVDAIGIAVVTLVVMISVSKLYAKKHGYRIDTSQEPYAYGITNIVASIFNGFVGNSALSRCGLLSTLDPASLLSSAVASIVLLVVVLLLGPYFKHLPSCVLASIIIVALQSLLFQFDQLPKLWHHSKIDMCIWLVSFLAVIITGVREGLIIGILFALFTTVLRAQRPPATLLGRLPGTDIYKSAHRYRKNVEVPGIKIFRFDAPLMFINADLFRHRLYNECGIDIEQARSIVNEEYRNRMSCGCQIEKIPIEDAPRRSTAGDLVMVDARRSDAMVVTKCSKVEECMMNIKQALRRNLPAFIIIDCSGFNYFDAQGITTLMEVAEELMQIRVEVIFGAMKSYNRKKLLETDGFHRNPVNVNPSNIFPTIHDAVIYAQNQLEHMFQMDNEILEKPPVQMVPRVESIKEVPEVIN